jgi:molybdenum cofactor cytidylyltransferase
VSDGIRRNPTIFQKTFFPQLKRLKGDMGAREIIRRHSEQVLYVDIDNPHYFLDIDTEGDLAALQQKTDHVCRKPATPAF